MIYRKHITTVSTCSKTYMIEERSVFDRCCFIILDSLYLNGPFNILLIATEHVHPHVY